MIDYTLILNYKYPKTEWVLNGEDYEGLEWLSNSPKPTKAALDQLWDEVQSLIQAEKQAKIDARNNALAKLEAIGLNEDDLKALGL
jgi:hypothetical protein